MKNKTFREKIGDILDHMGKRFLVCLGIAAVGILLCFIPFGFAIGAFLAYFGVYGMLSVIPKKKTYLIGSVNVTSPDGKTIPCVLIKQKHYAYMPIVPIFCPFYYFSFKTQYYLLRNVTAKTPEKPKRVHNNIILSSIIEAKKLTHSEFKAIAENNQTNSFYEEIKADAENARAQYLSDIEHFVSTGLLEEVFYNERLAVCRIGEDNYVLLHFSRNDSGQQGLAITKELFEALKKDDSDVFEAYIEHPQILGYMIVLNERTLERMLNAPEFKDSVKKEEAEKAREEMDKNKKPLTRELITEQLRDKLVSKNKFWGFFWAAWCAFFVPIGFLGGIPGIIVFSILFGGFSGYLSYDFFKAYFTNKKNLESGRFIVVRASCTEIEDKSDSESTYYVYKFSNGESVGSDKISCREGDYYYFVYPEGHKVSSVFFSVLEYAPAPDITVQNYL